MRANLFTYWKPDDDRIRELSKSPKATLLELMPGLRKVIGDFDVPGKVERACIDLYVVEPPKVPGALFVADACQSVCPATGTGLSKLLTDVDILLDDRISEWLSSPGMSADKLAGFYSESRKIATDHHSLSAAMRRRSATVEPSAIRWWINRLKRNIHLYRSTSKSSLVKSGP